MDMVLRGVRRRCRVDPDGLGLGGAHVCAPCRSHCFTFRRSRPRDLVNHGAALPAPGRACLVSLAMNDWTAGNMVLYCC